MLMIRFLHPIYGFVYVARSKSSIGVAYRRHLQCPRDVSRLSSHFVHGEQSYVRVASRTVYQPGTGDVDRLESSFLYQHTDGRIESPRKHHRLVSN